MTTQDKIRLHRFHDTVALSFPDTEQLYLTPENAKALARELTRFANNATKDQKWVATRVIQDGKATTASTGKRAVVYV